MEACTTRTDHFDAFACIFVPFCNGPSGTLRRQVLQSRFFRISFWAALVSNRVLGSMGGVFLGESNLKKLFVTVSNAMNLLLLAFSDF